MYNLYIYISIYVQILRWRKEPIGAYITVVKITSLCSHVLEQGMQDKCIHAIISINLLQ